MKRLVLSFLLVCPTSFSAYPSLVESYLDSVQIDDQEQHDCVERALESLELLPKEDLVIVMGYLFSIMQRVENDCGCDCCCDSVIDQMIEQEYATHGDANCGISL